MAAGPGSWPSFRYIAGAGATLLLLWGAVQLLGAIVQPLLLVVVAVLLAFLVHYPLDFFGRWLPRSLATLLTLLLLLSLVAAVGRWILPQLYHQAGVLLSRFPSFVDEVATWWDVAQRQSPLAQLPESAAVPERVESELFGQIGALVGNALPLAYDILTVVLAAVFVLAVAFFLAFRPDLYVEGLLRLVPEAREGSVRAFLHRLAFVVRGWLVGALVSMSSVGALTALGTWALGLESWLVLAFLSFALEVVPYAGPILAAIPAVALALTESPILAIYTALLYLGIQLVEGNAITPIIMKRAIELPPALLLLWQIAVVAAFGIIAIFVAAPLLAVVLVAVDHFYVKQALGKR